MKNIFSESLNENDFNYKLSNYFCLSLILKNYFDIGCFNFLIYYIYFARNFVDFFDLESFRNSYFVKVIFVFSYYNYLGVIFLNYIYCECFYLVNSVWKICLFYYFFFSYCKLLNFFARESTDFVAYNFLMFFFFQSRTFLKILL